MIPLEKMVRRPQQLRAAPQAHQAKHSINAAKPTTEAVAAGTTPQINF